MILSGRYVGVAVAAFAASVIGRSITGAINSTWATSAPLADAARAAEVARIRAHFDSVLTELSPASSRNGLSLDPARRERRANLVATLRSYRDRGDFPHNYDFPGRAVPYFVDRKTGTLCAVAHLLASTGRRDIVDRVAARDNNVWVAALAGDTAFTSWLDANGVTLHEAARIQVPYDNGMSSNVVVPIIAGSMISAVTAVGTGLYNATANRDGHGKWGNRIGLVSGLLTTAAGSAYLATVDSPGQQNIGLAATSIGATSAALGIHGMWSRHRTLAANREAGRNLDRRRAASASISPLLPIGNGQGAGLTVAIRF